MVQAAPQPQNNWIDRGEGSTFLDPMLIRVARQIYLTYREVHPQRLERPLGVVMHRQSYRGHLIFKTRPALLPQECFVPFDQIESQL